MFRMTPHGQRLSNGGLTDSHLPLDVPGGSLNLGYLRRVRISNNPHTRVNKEDHFYDVAPLPGGACNRHSLMSHCQVVLAIPEDQQLCTELEARSITFVMRSPRLA